MTKLEQHENKKETSIDSVSSTTEKICEAAIHLFGKNGVDGTSVREIADLAQVNPSLINYHFGGKEGLYHRILESFGRKELEVMERILKSPLDEAEFKLRFRMFIEELIEVHHTRPELFLILSRFFERIDEKSEEIFRDTFQHILNRIIGFIKESQDLGFANPKIEPLHLANVLMGGINEIFRMRTCQVRFLGKDYDDANERRALTESIVELALNGLIQNK